MISDENRRIVNKSLKQIASSIDLDETRYKKAETSYVAIGEWLSKEDSNVSAFSPQIFSQGSFSVGTVVKPSNEDFDLDFVCLMENDPGLSSQETFQLIGERLKSNDNYKNKLEQKNRCWRVSYEGDFHLDVIPAVPDKERKGTAILIPDQKFTTWVKSDPKGYQVWFRKCMHKQNDIEKNLLAQFYENCLEDIPDYFKKTELQMAVQLLKRHRDLLFQGSNNKDKPISIIITTLAARAFEDFGFQNDLLKTLELLGEQMSLHINQNVPRIPNPTNRGEDFADKWEDHPEREKAFYGWVEKLINDIYSLEDFSSTDEINSKIKQMFIVRGQNEISNKSSDSTSVLLSKINPHLVLHREDPALKWLMKLTPEKSVKVSGFINQKNSHDNEFYSNCFPLEKGLSLHFLARPTNIDRPYEVHWQVVNTGKEAQYAENGAGLRGGFYESNSNHRRNESTQYSGVHWIEAFIIKDGVCLARSGEFIVNIK